MKEIVGISLQENGKMEYYAIENFKLKKGYNVLVKTDRGIEFGKVVTDIHPIDASKLKKELKPINRLATKQDYYTHRQNCKDAKEAYKKCQALAHKHKLDMKILDASYTFDRDQLMFKFYAESRIDFRELTKELASIYKTRIELRQVGVRDKAKQIGGYGSCGQTLCCSRFLNEFDSVSISMAKNQNISLNPSKINGICGRLLCCLKYEDECYKECRKGLPTLGSEVETNEGKGKVIQIDILNRTYKVLLTNGNIVEENCAEN